jgi:hypothetical protein
MPSSTFRARATAWRHRAAVPYVPSWRARPHAPWRRGRRTARRAAAHGGSRRSWPWSRPSARYRTAAARTRHAGPGHRHSEATELVPGTRAGSRLPGSHHMPAPRGRLDHSFTCACAGVHCIIFFKKKGIRPLPLGLVGRGKEHATQQAARLQATDARAVVYSPRVHTCTPIARTRTITNRPRRAPATVRRAAPSASKRDASPTRRGSGGWHITDCTHVPSGCCLRAC